MKRFKEINPTTQFGHIGCQEAQHVIKRALQLCHQHGHESYTIFVDLVKAFNAVHHDLLRQILIKYGLPLPVVNNIQKLYRNCKVKIKIGEILAEINYSTGVHQGDNMSSILFLFVIEAFLDPLQLQDPSIQFNYFPKTKPVTSNPSKADS